MPSPFLSRRALLRLAGRAGVGVAGIALVGCGGAPETFNDRREEPDAGADAPPERDVPSQTATRTATVAEAEQSEEQAQDAGPVSAEPPASSSGTALENRWAGFEPVDATEWRERYHWSRLAEAPGWSDGPATGGMITLSTPSPNLFSPLDSSGAGFGAEATVLPLLYSQLVALAAGDERDAHRAIPEGDLAAGWEWPDAQTLVFQLRRDAEWPADGEFAAASLTASDIQRSHDLLRADSSPHAELYRAVEQIETDDDAASISFRLSEPAAYLLPALTGPQQVVMPPEWEADAPPMFGSAPRGTGPFDLQHHGGPFSTWSVRRKRGYFKSSADAAAPHLSGVSGGILASRSAEEPFSVSRDEMLGDWLSGRFDAISLAHPAELADALDPFPNAVVQVVAPVPGVAPTIYFDEVDPMLADPRVRRALSMSIDRQRLIDEMHGGLAAPDCGMNWTHVADETSESGFREWPWTVEELGESFQFDPEAARMLLDAAGRGASEPVRLKFAGPAPAGAIVRPAEARIPELAANVAGQWSEALGELAEIEFLPRGVEREVRGRTVIVPVPVRDVNVGLAAPQPRYLVDPDPSLAMRSLARAAVDERSLNAARLAELWRAQGHARAAEPRSDLLEQIRQLRAEAMREIPLVNPYGLHVRRGNVHNLATTYFAHSPMGAPKQLERTWKRLATG